MMFFLSNKASAMMIIIINIILQLFLQKHMKEALFDGLVGHCEAGRDPGVRLHVGATTVPVPRPSNTLVLTW